MDPASKHKTMHFALVKYSFSEAARRSSHDFVFASLKVLVLVLVLVLEEVLVMLVVVKYVKTFNHADGQVPTSNFQSQTSNFQLPTSNFQVSTPNFQVPSSNSQLPTPNFQLAALRSAVSTVYLDVYSVRRDELKNPQRRDKRFTYFVQ